MPSPSDPFEVLERAAMSLEAGRPIADDVALLVAGVIKRLVAGATLDEALGCPGESSKPSASRTYRLRRRNEALRELFMLADGNNSMRAVAVIDWCNGTAPPPPGARVWVDRISAMGLRVPEVRHFLDIIAESHPAFRVTSSNCSSTVTSKAGG